MTRRQFGNLTAASAAAAAMHAQPSAAQPLLPGIWRLRFGTPERLTPVRCRRYAPAERGLQNLAALPQPPFSLSSIVGRLSPRGYVVTLPLAPGEMIYGLGLQFHSVIQRGLKKKLRVNADPVADIGDSHAPVPFYVSTLGYGVLIDSARYVNIYCGNKVRKGEDRSNYSPAADVASRVAQLPKSFGRYHMEQPSEVLIEIPEAQGADVYLFGGPSMREAVQRYNLFAGGGALPPRWGLGFWYRCYGQFDQAEVLALAQELRNERIPCDVLGLEPGWQSHSYSCSFVWSDKFRDPAGMLAKLGDLSYRVNLWEHAFTHPTSPLYSPLLPYSGDYTVWDGLVPDFLDERARDTFGDYHERQFIAQGISGFKLDECDNSDYTGSWSFPELSRFPSGADGEQMHCFFGLRYQDAIQSVYERRKERTFGLVRSSHALAAPYPYVLYSDLYDHKQFIRAIVTAGFSGLLWCPEVRDANDSEDLLRRLQTVVFSPVAMINAWYIKHPPWKQVDRTANNQGKFAEHWDQVEAQCRRWIELRMTLHPYLYSAFVRYHLEGIPPFRALVMDFPDDPQTWALDNQYLAGDDLLVAPVVAGEYERDVYLPHGDWFDFWTHQRVTGGRTLQVSAPLDRVPVFVRSGTVLPYAQPTLHTGDIDSLGLTVHIYGNGHRSCVLYEDDGSVYQTFTSVTLKWDSEGQTGTVIRSGQLSEHSYTVKRWDKIA